MNLNRKIIAGVLAASAVWFGVAHAQAPGCGPDGRPGMKGSSMQRGGMMEPGARAEQPEKERTQSQAFFLVSYLLFFITFFLNS